MNVDYRIERVIGYNTYQFIHTAFGFTRNKSDLQLKRFTGCNTDTISLYL